jgi:8-oxo-dGTP diphosphatase
MRKGQYIPPTITVDAVVFQIVDNRLSVLLIRRAGEPFRGHWALPGVYNQLGETTREAMSRALSRKAGVNPDDINAVDQLFTFDTVARDPRGHAVSVTYMALGDDFQIREDDAQNPAWFAVDDLPELAFDHADIIDFARKRLASKITYSNLIAGLLPEEFTLSELQAAYEAVLGRMLDKRNFRKKFLGLDFIRETNKTRQNGAHRPAKLYKFMSRKLQYIETKF